MSASEKERENMSLYSVLLVDDEEEVFQVIMKKLDWEGMGFRIALPEAKGAVPEDQGHYFLRF